MKTLQKLGDFNKSLKKLNKEHYFSKKQEFFQVMINKLER